jgi:benzoyl-CoA reductase/2-hydroxyglutaryl-CoA dehydratase subunit BcrC/BadD/HgdB
MGLEPLVLWGLKPFFPATPKSDQRLQNFVCSVGRHLAEFVLSDAGALLDGIFMYNACDTLRNLPEILRSGLEDEGRRLPILNAHIPMAPLGQTDARQYLGGEIAALIRGTEETFGVKFSETRFGESVSSFRRARDLARRLEGAVKDGRLGFRRFADVVQGNCFRAVEEQVRAMESLLSQCTEGRSGLGVILSGILPPPSGVSDIIEGTGLRIVGNDIASMARSYARTPVAWDSVEAYYADFYYNHHPCTTLLGSADARIHALETLVRERGARGIIFIGEKFCEYEYFEFPFLMKRFKEQAVHSLLLEFSMDDDLNPAPVRTRVEAFAEMIQ